MLENFHSIEQGRKSGGFDKKPSKSTPLDEYERAEFAQALADAQQAAGDGSRPWPGEDEAA